MFILIPIKFKNENPQVSPEGLHFTNKARAINGLAEIGGRRDEIAALMDLYRLEVLNSVRHDGRGKTEQTARDREMFCESESRFAAFTSINT